MRCADPEYEAKKASRPLLRSVSFSSCFSSRFLSLPSPLPPPIVLFDFQSSSDLSGSIARVHKREEKKTMPSPAPAPSYLQSLILFQHHLQQTQQQQREKDGRSQALPQYPPHFQDHTLLSAQKLKVATHRRQTLQFFRECSWLPWANHPFIFRHNISATATTSESHRSHS